MNFSHFTTGINFINNDIKNIKSVSDMTITKLNDLLHKLKNSSVYLSSERELFITLFKEKGYKIHQWLSKFDQDFINFNSFCLEILAGYSATPPSSKREIDNQLKELSNNFELIQRHTCFIYLIDKMIPIVGVADFKSTEQILSLIGNNDIIIDILKKN